MAAAPLCFLPSPVIWPWWKDGNLLMLFCISSSFVCLFFCFVFAGILIPFDSSYVTHSKFRWSSDCSYRKRNIKAELLFSPLSCPRLVVIVVVLLDEIKFRGRRWVIHTTPAAVVTFSSCTMINRVQLVFFSFLSSRRIAVLVSYQLRDGARGEDSAHLGS